MLDLTQYIGQTIYIGFRQHNVDNSITPSLTSAIGIDDVKVSSILLGVCNGSAPESLAVSEITQPKARVDWDPKADATYVLRYKRITGTAWTEVPLTAYAYTINGLEKDANYEVQVATVFQKL
ncbi:fibronectin type III domain-containing protein [Chryseobacterium sp. Ch-15]|uniref:Fibronectin type III domain-containing protein n=1 Tax=Chryseobacterium muglaense TaxID=2893752 RepID=A0A9Q3YUS9_9FLAO|nr:fibronectin type III domain-containing protein [Chryseobacterium muglaense]MBD3903266.1 fibronectin type III domain-containing protein [Chryseobacterium muglaense]MCC9036097.1 fibronectin type III domain-containing protein [Chryseobacterium muglaense]MCM2553327.1 fibronectin type III domain-containing protein [Chryseobacterium muglaense]